MRHNDMRFKSTNENVFPKEMIAGSVVAHPAAFKTNS